MTLRYGRSVVASIHRCATGALFAVTQAVQHEIGDRLRELSRIDADLGSGWVDLAGDLGALELRLLELCHEFFDPIFQSEPNRLRWFAP